MTAPAFHPAADAETLHVLGDRVSIRAAAPGSALVVVDVEVPPGSGVPPHRHPSPELFRVLEGEILFWTESGERPAGAGDLLAVPPDAPHGYRNAGAATARMTVLVDAAMAAFFRAAGSASAPPPGPPSAELVRRVMSLAKDHGIVMTG